MQKVTLFPGDKHKTILFCTIKKPVKTNDLTLVISEIPDEVQQLERPKHSVKVEWKEDL